MSVRARLMSFGLAFALVAPALLALAPAHAGNVTVGCAGLQPAFDNSNPGDRITLNRMCTGMHFDLPSHRIIFQGKAGVVAGLDATGLSGEPLNGQDVRATVIRNLTFRDSDAGTGAIDIFGASAPRIINCRFFRNNSNASGSALALSQNTAIGSGIVVRDNVFGGKTLASGNHAGSGVVHLNSIESITVQNNLFRNNRADDGGAIVLFSGPGARIDLSNNTFRGNRAVHRGGAVELVPNGPTLIAGNTFRGNRLEGPTLPGYGREGGALALQLPGSPITVTQMNNVFTGNSVASHPSFAVGGAEFITSDGVATVKIKNDRFIKNRVGGAGLGGGIFNRQADQIGTAKLTLTNTVVAGNSVGASGQGGGVFGMENCAGPCETQWTFKNSTVAGNTVGTGGAGSQMRGQLANTLTMLNSIGYGGGTAGAVSGFESMTISFSDVCGAGGAPTPGTGNICKKPKLKDASAGDVHETFASPTRDKGKNSLVPASLKRDYEGNARIIDSDHNGSKRVDMGADERRA